MTATESLSDPTMATHQWVLTMMYDSVNVSHVPAVTSQAVPEPTPDWFEGKATWKWGWYLHNYGFGCAFFVLALCAVINAFEFRKRLKVQQYLLGINAMLLLLGVTRASYLLADPYESTGQLPTAVARVFYGVAFPCLTSSFNLIQMVFMRITRVHMGPSKLHNYRVLAAIITSHFTIVIVIDITVAYKNNLKLLLLLCQSIFITWGLVLCFGFVYGGFKMSQFTTETQRVLKQLAVYQKVKLETQKDGNRRDLALHRISKPKIKFTDEERGTQSYYSDTSLMDSSDSLSYFNEAPLDFEEDLIARACMAQYEGNAQTCRFKERATKIHRRPCTYRPDRYSTQIPMTRNSSNQDLSSDSEYVTDTPSPSTAVTPNDENTPGTNKHDSKVGNGDIFVDVELEKSNFTSDTTVHTVESEVNGIINPALEIKSPDEKLPRKVNGFVHTLDYNAQCDTITLEENDKELSQEQQCENGYMADTELSSPKRKRKRGRSKHKDNVEEEEEDRDTSSPMHRPYPLPITEGTVSLYRIRQGRMLHKALKVSYLTTLLGFVCCILELYAMFGVYGVLSTEVTAEPWPWFIFHTVFRLAEFGMGLSIAVTTFLFGRYRYRPRARRSRRQTEDQTKC